jgi:arginase
MPNGNHLASPPGVVLLDAPSNLGLRPPKPGAIPGVWGLPAALRNTGLREALRAEDAGTLPAPPYDPAPEPVTGFRNGEKIRAYSVALADRLRGLLRQGKFPVVLGGDCSILLGPSLALRQEGRFGLVFMDGHDDFSPLRHPGKFAGLFAAAGRDLGLVTGHGPEALTNLRGLKPYVREEDVTLFGYYPDPADDQDYDTALISTTAIHRYPIDAIRQEGVRRAAEKALQRLDAGPTKGFWIHVDADVLDQSLMPAVDSPNPKGLTYEELSAALTVFLASPKAVGLEITVYDPELDPHGVYAQRLSDSIIAAFVRSGRVPSENGPSPRIKGLDSRSCHPTRVAERML